MQIMLQVIIINMSYNLRPLFSNSIFFCKQRFNDAVLVCYNGWYFSYKAFQLFRQNESIVKIVVSMPPPIKRVQESRRQLTGKHMVMSLRIKRIRKSLCGMKEGRTVDQIMLRKILICVACATSRGSDNVLFLMLLRFITVSMALYHYRSMSMSVANIATKVYVGITVLVSFLVSC